MAILTNSPSVIEEAIALVGVDALERELTSYELELLETTWEVWRRPSQTAPSGEWLTWLLLGGRGLGKTRAGAEWIRSRDQNGDAELIAFVGKTPADVRDVMIEGESGLLSVYPKHERPIYRPSLRRIDFKSGAVGHTYSSENPEQLRGPQHDTAWVDELGKFNTNEAWDNLQMGMRLGKPRQIVTTTPRPVKSIRSLVKDSEREHGSTMVTSGSSYENRANLAETFYSTVIKPYEGTRLGEQELMGRLLDDVPGALWKREFIRYRDLPASDQIRRVVVGVDPSASSSEQAAECGIVAACITHSGDCYVMDDWSLRGDPAKWAKTAVDLYHFHNAHRLVAEKNQGGAMVEYTLRTIDDSVAITLVHASQGKQARAEPVSALYERGKVHHVKPLDELEDQMCTWTHEDGESPDRLDALVWTLHELALKPGFRMVPVQ